MIATTAEAGLDFVGIIIFLVVIGRIVSAIKKASSSGQGAADSSPPGTPRKLESDLERFFQNIANQSRGGTQEEPPPPPPVRAAAAHRKAASVKRAEPAAPVPRARPVVVSQPSTWGSESYGIDPAVPHGASCTEDSTAASTRRAEISALLKSRNSTKNAILLREILGPPVAMRG